MLGGKTLGLSYALIASDLAGFTQRTGRVEHTGLVRRAGHDDYVPEHVGFFPWFTDKVSGIFEGVGWVTAFLILSLICFYSHYFFASNTAQSARYARRSCRSPWTHSLICPLWC